MKRDPRTERVKRERFMPFRFERGAIHIGLVHGQLDDQAPFGPDADEEERAEVHLEDDQWDVLQLRLAVSMDEEVLSRVIPEQERGKPPVHCVLALHEPRTRLRRSVLVVLDGEGRAEVDLRLDRHEVAAPVSLTPWLVRSEAGPFVPGHANEVGHRLATGRTFTVSPYAPHVRPGQFLDVQYKSFQDDPNLRHQAYRVYYLDVAADVPALFVNSDNPEVVEALDAKGQTGIKARLREVFYDVLSVGVWTQLFLCSVEALSEEGEARHPWQTGVLAELLPKMFPRVRNQHLRIAELLAVREDDHALSLLSGLCDQALQQQLDLAKHMQRLVQESVGAVKS